MKIRLITGLVMAALAGGAGRADASGLRGSLASMRNQHDVAIEEQYTFLRTPSQVREYAAGGRLDTVPGNADYRVNKVSFPYARPEVVSFLERLAREYRSATGERLVVTSLTRPTALQPRNAHKLSVHPAGMAVDLRVPFTPSERDWLEARLLELEKAGVLDVTRERNPPHYHVAVFPGEFREWAAANPVALDRDAAASVVRHLSAMMQAPIGTVAPSVTAATSDIGGGFEGWLFAVLAALAALVGGSAARRGSATTEF